MKNRAVRVALLLLGVLAFAAAGYELVLLEDRAVAARAAGDVFEQQARRLSSAVGELRAAHYAYTAPGQGREFWTTRAAALLASIAADLPRLCASATEKSACGEAANDVITIERLDAGVRTSLHEDQVLAAGDVVFGDLREANQALSAHIDDIRVAQAAADAATAAALRTRELATVAGATLFAVLLLLLLTPGGAAKEAATTSSSELRASDEPGTSLADSQPIHRPEPPLTGSTLGLSRSIDPPIAAAEVGTPATPTDGARTAGEPRWPATPKDTVGAADLSATAALCTAFAQLHQSADLQALLERVASLLDAAGIVVWVDDPSCNELRPALSHGYAPQALARMRGISRDDRNATAMAFRERVLRVVPGDGAGHGAIAVPLMAPGSCVGVMAAEIRGGRECDRSTQALATIIAAQLATLVTPQVPSGKSDEADDSDFTLQLDD